MSQAKAQSCDNFNTFMIVINKITTWGESNKFKAATFGKTKTFWTRVVPFIDYRKKERVFEEIVLYLKKRMLSRFLVAYA